MDGVLADFDKRATEILYMPPQQFEDKYGSKLFWTALTDTPGFFNTFDPMPDAWRLVKETRKYNPVVLTGLPKSGGEDQKRKWMARHFDLPVICCKSKDKALWCERGDVLVDDRVEYRHLWLLQGGHYIVHKDANTSLLAVEAILG